MGRDPTRTRGPREADRSQGIGPKIATKIEEILATGSSRKLQALESNEEVWVCRWPRSVQEQQMNLLWGV